ncbi:hypothetical protein KXD40_000260 [Peronospora effusa]|nr:hypothetical protein KXD40_000260 [Peronospora effusa]
MGSTEITSKDRAKNTLTYVQIPGGSRAMSKEIRKKPFWKAVGKADKSRRTVCITQLNMTADKSPLDDM